MKLAQEGRKKAESMPGKEKRLSTALDLTKVESYQEGRQKLSSSIDSSHEDERIRQSGVSIGWLHLLIVSGKVNELLEIVLNDYAKADEQINTLNLEILQQFQTTLLQEDEDRLSCGEKVYEYPLISKLKKQAKDLSFDELAELNMRQISPQLRAQSFDQMNSITYAALLLRDSISEFGQGIGHLASDTKMLSFLLKLCREFFKGDKSHQPFLGLQDNYGDTPLHVHCRAGNADVALMILDASKQYGFSKLVVGNIAPHARNIRGETALFDALRSKKSEIINALLDQNVETDVRSFRNDEDGNFIVKGGNTPLHIVAEYGVVDSFAKCLDGFMKLVEVESETENEDEDEDFDVNKIDVTLLQNNEGLTPLDLAVIEGNVSAVDVLLKDESYMNLEKQFEKYHRKVPLMHYALARLGKKHLEIATLLHSYNVEQINQSDEAERLIAQYWVNATDKVDRTVEPNIGLNTPLHIAAANGNFFGVVWLLSLMKQEKDIKKSLVDTIAKNTLGMTAMHFACQNGMTQIAQYLYYIYFPSLDRTTTELKTPIELACEAGQDGLVESVLSHSVPFDSETEYLDGGKQIVRTGLQEMLQHNVDIKQSPLQLAALEGRALVIRAIFTAMERKEFTKDPVDYPPGLSPLELAYEREQHEAAKTYLGHPFAYPTLKKCMLDIGHAKSSSSNNIRKILNDYSKETWCGKTPEKFFDEEREKLDKLISSGLLPNSIEDDSKSLSDSGKFGAEEDSDLLSDQYTLVKGYESAVKKEVARLKRGFARLAFKDQLDRIIIIMKLVAIFTTVNDESLLKEEKAQFINEQYKSMGMLLKSETVKDAVKMICLSALGIVAGIAVGAVVAGLSAAFAAAPTAIYIVACAIACGGGAALACYLGLFRGKKAHKKLNQLTLKQLEQNEPTITMAMETL